MNPTVPSDTTNTYLTNIPRLNEWLRPGQKFKPNNRIRNIRRPHANCGNAGRQRCICGSGKRFKSCCARKLVKA